MNYSYGSKSYGSRQVGILRIISTKTFLWNICEKIIGTHTFIWNILGRITNTRIFLWNITQKVLEIETLSPQNLPTTATVYPDTGQTINWSSINNIKLADEVGAVASMLENTESYYALGRTYAFNLSTDGYTTIDGIEVEIKIKHSNSVNNIRADVRLSKTGVIGTYELQQSSIPADGLWHTYTFGSSIDLWGTTWLVSDINSSTTGGVVSVIRPTDGVGGTVQVYLDYIKVKVYYTHKYNTLHTFLWDICERVTNTRTFLWNIWGRVTNTRTFLWNIWGRVIGTHTFLWDIGKQWFNKFNSQGTTWTNKYISQATAWIEKQF